MKQFFMLFTVLFVLMPLQIEAQEKQQVTPQLITVHDRDCGYCHELLYTVYQDSTVKEQLTNYDQILVEANTEDATTYKEKYNISAYPTQIIIADEQPIIVEGLLTVEEQIEFLANPLLYATNTKSLDLDNTQPTWIDDVDDICDELEDATDEGQNQIEATRLAILDVIGADTKIDMKSAEMIDILNNNLKYFKCENSETVNVRDEATFFKFALELRQYKFVSDLIFSLACGEGVDGKKLDINAYEMIDGEKETLLDYIDKILAKKGKYTGYNYVAVKKLRGKLTNKDNNCGALTGAQLSN